MMRNMLMLIASRISCPSTLLHDGPPGIPVVHFRHWRNYTVQVEQTLNGEIHS